MPFQRTTDGTEDDLPTYIRRAFGHDRSWMAEGSCAPHLRPRSTSHATWAVAHGETRLIDGVTYNGAVEEARALLVCMECPQQWLCGRWAVEVEEDAGTWAMPLRLLRWLKRQPDATSVIDHARVNDVPVQIAVSLVYEVRVGIRV